MSAAGGMGAGGIDGNEGMGGCVVERAPIERNRREWNGRKRNGRRQERRGQKGAGGMGVSAEQDDGWNG